ncbi:MarR family transcriptional regulator [Paractinoplanes globisporus]|uniref:MarR family transcriptional regulator n=1 Tax=Paractinoplanes globisporus TaxID=113565 RepID=A0ABW6WI90_9ACTN|nr:MarR family transcriptional regulator [Actinoplanes globisporus]
MTETTAATAAEAVAAILTAHPDGITTRDVAEATGRSLPVITKALTAMATAGTVRRTPGDGTKNGELWHPIPATAEPDAPADNDPDTADKVAVDADSVADEPVRPRRTDLKVLLMAEVLADNPAGITADDAISISGLTIAAAEKVLVAMEIAGAAYRLPIDENDAELWIGVPEADLITVDPGSAPAHGVCETCGQVRRVRTTTRAFPRTAVPATTTSAGSRVNGDGSTRLAPGELKNMVEAFMRNLGPDHELTPGTVGLGLGRSPGACANAMDKLARADVLVMTREAPAMYAVSTSAPDPSEAVLALMTRLQGQ